MDFNSIDIYKALLPMVTDGSWFWRADNGKLDRVVSTQESRTPWIYHHPDHKADCYFWNDVIFQKFDLLPSFCMNCYKVVVVPDTVEQLFKLCDMQEQMYALPCKCGLEIRDEVARSYGGYFYNIGKDRGLDCYRLVRDLVDKYIGQDVRVFLKRACTEFERKFGRSDGWEIESGQIEFEKKIFDLLTPPPKVIGQPDDLKKHIKNKWVQWAHARGDMTYLKFTDGKPLHEPYVIYAGEL